MVKQIARLMMFALALGASEAALAQTLYKLIHKNGKITYAEKPPKDFDGQVIRMDIDPNRNTATLPRSRAEGDAAASRAQGEDRVAKAREQLDRAKKALTDARDNPGDGDVQRLGKVGGGARPEFSDDYRARLEKLEAAVKAAEEELKEAQRAS